MSADRAPRAVVADDGARIRYLDTGAPRPGAPAGDALPLLLVHGFPQSRAFWAPQLAAHAADRRCLAPDLRGFGESTDVPAGAAWTIDRHADDLVAVLDDAGVARAAVCGLSMGGYVALALWRRHPARVAALVLADTRAGADGDEARRRRDETVALAERAGSAAVADAQLPGALGRSSREGRPDVVARYRALLAAAPVPGIVAASRAMRDRPDATPVLATITVPTLVVVGAEDAVTPPREAAALHAAIAGSRLAVIPEAGHVSSWERPEIFDAELRRFLDALPAGGH